MCNWWKSSASSEAHSGSSFIQWLVVCVCFCFLLLSSLPFSFFPRLSQRQRYITTSQRISQDTSHHCHFLHDSPTWTHQQRDTNKQTNKNSQRNLSFGEMKWNEGQQQEEKMNRFKHVYFSHTCAFPRHEEDPSITIRTPWVKDEVQQGKWKWTWMCLGKKQTERKRGKINKNI